eukprot:m.21725 g.21725  ORF g.21725 m.21725 type:complete len:698 (+) comp7217_c0_seq1:401-2494(+)
MITRIMDMIKIRKATPLEVFEYIGMIFLSKTEDKTFAAAQYQDFVGSTTEKCDLRVFVAEEETGNLVGCIGAQVWKGPIPAVVKENLFKLGCVWGLHCTGSDSMQSMTAIKLVEASTQYLKDLGCMKVLTSYGDSKLAKYALTHASTPYAPANLLTMPHPFVDSIVREDSPAEIVLAGQDEDKTVVQHWHNMWTEVGVPEEGLDPNFNNITKNFISEARDTKQYQTIAAIDKMTKKTIGTVSCQIWEGPAPQVTREKVGTIWAVYVDPSHRRRGIGTDMMKRTLKYLADIGCKSSTLLYASEGGRRIYERLGFEHADNLVCDLTTTTTAAPETPASTPAPLEEQEEEEEEVETNETVDVDSVPEEAVDALLRRLSGCTHVLKNLGDRKFCALLLSATTEILDAVFNQDDDDDSCFTDDDDKTDTKTKHDESLAEIRDIVVDVQKEFSLHVNPKENWFTQHKSKMGRGFDMEKLKQDPQKLAAKFNKLAPTYDHWTTGNKSRVQHWLCKKTQEYLQKHSTTESEEAVLDVACGIGLPGQTMRLAGYSGHISGTDISEEMVKRARKRGYDHTFVADANTGLQQVPTESKDIVVCLGAMELLNHGAVLREFARILKPGGLAWVSFQADDTAQGIPCPTAHQNVFGVTLDQIRERLHGAGLKLASSDHVHNAFATPSPQLNGELLPVAYWFVQATTATQGA